MSDTDEQSAEEVEYNLTESPGNSTGKITHGDPHERMSDSDEEHSADEKESPFTELSPEPIVSDDDNDNDNDIQDIKISDVDEVSLVSTDREYSFPEISPDHEDKEEEAVESADVIETDEVQETKISDTDEQSADEKEYCLTEMSANQNDGVRHRRPGVLPVNGRPAKQRKVVHRQKARKILELLNQDPVDVAELRQQAISRGGLLNDSLRRTAWPILLNVNVNNITPKPAQEVLKGHRDYQQVVLDVERSLRRFPPGMEESHRLSLQDALIDVIMRVLVKHPELYYYQGFHDICVTFLLVVDEDLAFALCEKVAINHLRDYMEPTMERTTQLLNYLPPLLKKANPELHDYLEKAELGCVFCISWLLTWFGHVLSDIESILRIFDFFIANHPLMPIYLTGAIVLHREEEIFATEPEMPFLHALLSKVPDTLPFEQLLSHAGDLYLQYPPTELANEALRRHRKAQEAAAQRRARVTERQASVTQHMLADGNVTFTKVTCWMLGAVVSVAAYAFFTSMEWDLSQWMPHG